MKGQPAASATLCYSPAEKHELVDGSTAVEDHRPLKAGNFTRPEPGLETQENYDSIAVPVTPTFCVGK